MKLNPSIRPWLIALGVAVTLVLVCCCAAKVFGSGQDKVIPTISGVVASESSASSSPAPASATVAPTTMPPTPTTAPPPAPVVAPHPDQLDPRYATCAEVKQHGLGPYVEEVDGEYGWYRDGDSDGIACE